jgi:UDP:flavonoid glycosyltransferase YjiC (YdhE family)
MHYLFAIWDGGGTVPVELGVARRLLAHGHTVTVLADPVLGPAVEASGAGFRPWETAPHRNTAAIEDDVLKDWECRNPLQLFVRVRDRIITGPAAEYARDVRTALTEQPADAVVANGALLGALAGAESMGVPAVALCPNVYLRAATGMPPFGLGWQPARGPIGAVRDRLVNGVLARLWRTGLPKFNAARAAIGLDNLYDPWQQWDRCARVQVLTSAVFDFPAKLPDNVSYVGPVLDDPSWTEPGSTETAADLPLVVAGFSSTYMKGQPGVLRRVVSALDSLPVRGMVTTGPAIDPVDVPGTPSVRVVPSAPHSRLFPRAAVVITHAGHGTIIKALASGVPVLCIPFGRDQRDNLARAKQLGVGLGLKPSASSDAIAAAVRRLLDERAFRERARALGEQIRNDVARSRLVPELAAVANGFRVGDRRQVDRP